MVLRVTISDVRKKAFFSGTDDSDDRGNCYVSGVIGKLSSTCEKVFRFNLPGNMKINPLPMNLIFEESAPAEVPAEWLAQVKKQTYTPPVNSMSTYSRNSGGAGGVNGYPRDTTTTPGGRVVANGNFRGANSGLGMESLGLSSDDTEVLNQFGFPFPYSGNVEDSDLPFPQRPLSQGRNRRNGKKVAPANKRLKAKDKNSSDR